MSRNANIYFSIYFIGEVCEHKLCTWTRSRPYGFRTYYVELECSYRSSLGLVATSTPRPPPSPSSSRHAGHPTPIFFRCWGWLRQIHQSKVLHALEDGNVWDSTCFPLRLSGILYIWECPTVDVLRVNNDNVYKLCLEKTLLHVCNIRKK